MPEAGKKFGRYWTLTHLQWLCVDLEEGVDASDICHPNTVIRPGGFLDSTVKGYIDASWESIISGTTGARDGIYRHLKDLATVKRVEMQYNQSSPYPASSPPNYEHLWKPSSSPHASSPLNYKSHVLPARSVSDTSALTHSPSPTSGSEESFSEFLESRTENPSSLSSPKLPQMESAKEIPRYAMRSRDVEMQDAPSEWLEDNSFMSADASYNYSAYAPTPPVPSATYRSQCITKQEDTDERNVEMLANAFFGIVRATLEVAEYKVNLKSRKWEFDIVQGLI
ncbi:uncharacterized protein KY384_008026 [Bacidia gigantensis]|uniref:uncharacterized protein n=1 Tax=Bacidia gigantensis TaxID=2732470 RepID=UPI001D03F2E5|nr:uncharacterized protein KY384_008026 [Bacidia gigantensis]KAG8527282.1 hypothetical protein KY384_008026 [Bacidia gigantensis]